MGGIGDLLGGLVKGWTGAEHDRIMQEVEANKAKVNQTMAYMRELATNPNVPTEHQQWAWGQMQQLSQYDPRKPWPKGLGDISQLPPAMQQNPARQAVTQPPGMTLTAPNAPPTAATVASVGAAPAVRMPSPPASFNITAPPPPPGDEVGRTSNGTVNALGAAGGPAQTSSSPAGPLAALLPQVPGLLSPPPPSPAAASSSQPAVSTGPPLTVPGAPLAPPVTLPPGPRTTVINTTPPTQLSAPGELHLLTPEERQLQAINSQQSAINRLQQIYPEKSPEDLAYFTMHGEFPKGAAGGTDKGFTLAPGQSRYDAQGNLIVRNDDAKPTGKTGFMPHNAPGGEPLGVIDNSTGAFLTPAQAAKNPDAKAVYDAAVDSHNRRRQEQIADGQAMLNRQMAMADYREQQKMRAEGRTAIMKYRTAYDLDTDRLKIMESNYEDGIKGNQQAMLSMLANHIGMTMGLQKGSRITQAIYNEAMQSAPMLQRAEAKFDKNGYLTGVVLTKEQMQQMLELGRQKAQISRERLNDTQDTYSDVLRPGGKGAGRAQIERPTPPGGLPGTLPPEAAAQLKTEGEIVTFGNGQQWKLQHGRPVRVK